MVAWKPDPEIWSATRAQRAFVEGYELVAFDIPPGAGGPQRVIGWEVWSPKLPGLGSPQEYAKRLHELMDNNDTFDELIETLERDRSIKREGMRQIASAFLGYTVTKSRGREENLNDIRRRQSSDEKRWAERMERIGLEPRGLEKGLSASFGSQGKIAGRAERRRAERLPLATADEDVSGTKGQRPAVAKQPAARDQPVAGRSGEQLQREINGRAGPTGWQHRRRSTDRGHVGDGADRPGLENAVPEGELPPVGLGDLEAAGPHISYGEGEILHDRHREQEATRRFGIVRVERCQIRGAGHDTSLVAAVTIALLEEIL